MVDLDELDKKILNEVQKPESCTPKITEIAKAVGRSSATVHSRLKRLEKEGVIRSYTAKISPDKIGYDLTSFMFVKFDRGLGKESLDNIVARISSVPEVKKVYYTMGEWDFMLKVVVKNVEDYCKVSQEIATISGIRDTKSKAVLKSYKLDDAIDIK